VGQKVQEGAKRVLGIHNHVTEKQFIALNPRDVEIHVLKTTLHLSHVVRPFSKL